MTLNTIVVNTLFGICSGVVATITMDVLGSFSRQAGLTVGAGGNWVGRWYLGIPHGTFFHENIDDVPERPGEVRAAMIGHYIIGIVLTVFYFVAALILGFPPDSFLLAIGFALATCIFPWFLVYPALGFGVFGRKGPPELKLFLSSVMNHFYYGLGVWWTAKLIALV